MKKYHGIYIVIGCLLFMSFQSSHAQMVDFGIYGGVNKSSISELDGRESNAGFQIGAFADFSFSSMPLSIQPEIFYVRLNSNGGGPVEYPRPPSHNFFSDNFDYLQLPVLLKFDFLEVGPYAHNIFMGPYGGYNIDAQTYFSPFASHDGINIKEYVNSFDYGLILGTEAQFRVQLLKINLGMRYQIGMRNVISENVTDILDEFDGYPSKDLIKDYFNGKMHRALSIHTGFSF